MDGSRTDTFWSDMGDTASDIWSGAASPYGVVVIAVGVVVVIGILLGLRWAFMRPTKRGQVT